MQLRDFAHMTQQSLPGLPGASSVPEPGPATPSSAARSVEEAAPALDPPQTVAGAFETHRRKTSGIMGKLSGLAQRLKASGVASATSDSDTVRGSNKALAVLQPGPNARGDAVCAEAGGGDSRGPQGTGGTRLPGRGRAAVHQHAAAAGRRHDTGRRRRRTPQYVREVGGRKGRWPGLCGFVTHG